LEKLLRIAMNPTISNRGSFPFFDNRDNDCLLPQFRESVLRWAKIKNKSENRYTIFRTALYNKTWHIINSK
jgi:hypothetical protein